MHVCIYIHLFMYRARYVYVRMCVCVSRLGHQLSVDYDDKLVQETRAAGHKQGCQLSFFPSNMAFFLYLIYN